MTFYVRGSGCQIVFYTTLVCALHCLADIAWRHPTRDPCGLIRYHCVTLWDLLTNISLFGTVCRQLCCDIMSVSWSITTCLEDGRSASSWVTQSGWNVWTPSRSTPFDITRRRQVTASTSTVTRQLCCSYLVSTQSASAVCTAVALSWCSPNSRSGDSFSSVQVTTAAGSDGH